MPSVLNRAEVDKLYKRSRHPLVHVIVLDIGVMSVTRRLKSSRCLVTRVHFS